MRTTITIDDSLYEQALELADPDIPKTEIFREAVKAKAVKAVVAGPAITKREIGRESVHTFVRGQAAMRLAALGGSAPDMADAPRRRQETAP